MGIKICFLSRCVNCTWPLCSNQCKGFLNKYGHSKEECETFSKSSVKNKEIKTFLNFYYALTPFRCLLLKKINPEKWKIIKNMESHTDERKKDGKLWETNEKMAVDIIKNFWGLSDDDDDNDIHFVCGILEVDSIKF